jgi:hypothetical protein
MTEKKPTEFQSRLMGHLTKRHNYNMTDLAWLMKSNRLAIYSAVRSLEQAGMAVTFRSDQSQWAVLLVSLSQKGRDYMQSPNQSTNPPEGTP